MKIYTDIQIDKNDLQIILEDVSYEESIQWLQKSGYAFFSSWDTWTCENLYITCTTPAGSVFDYHKFMYKPSAHKLYNADYQLFKVKA